MSNNGNASASTANQQSPLNCHLCPANNKFDDRASLAKHYYEKHSASYCCRYCTQQFIDGERLKKHIELSHMSMQLWRCDFCDFRGMNMKQMALHMRKQHKANENESSCNTCETVFYDRQCLKIHTSYCRGKEQLLINRTWTMKFLCKQADANLQHQPAANVDNVSHIATSITNAGKESHVKKIDERRVLLPVPPPIISPAVFSLPPSTMAVLCLCCFKRVLIGRLALHLDQHVIESGSSISCNECFEFVTHRYELSEHMGCYSREAQRWSQFSAGATPYFLCACGFCAKNKDQLERHRDWCHKNVKCRTCDETVVGRIGTSQHVCPPPNRDQRTTGQGSRLQSQPHVPAPLVVQQAQDADKKKVPDLSKEGTTIKMEVVEIPAPAAHPVVKEEPTANKNWSSVRPASPPQMAATRRRRQTSSSSSDDSDDDQQYKTPAKRPAPSIAGSASKMHRPTVAPRKPPKLVENVSSSSEDDVPSVKKRTTAVTPPEANASSKASVQSRHRKADSSNSSCSSSSASSSDDDEREPPRRSVFSAKDLAAAQRQSRPASSTNVFEDASNEYARWLLLHGFCVSRMVPVQENVAQCQVPPIVCLECEKRRKRIKRMETSLKKIVEDIEEANEKFDG